jgi:TonB family protein
VHVRVLFLAVVVFFFAMLSVAQTSPPQQTARQALIEMFFGDAPNHFEKHLPDLTRSTLKKLGSGNGMNALDEFSMFAAQAKAGGGKFETFETGPILIVTEDPRDQTKAEITVERDDLTGDGDQIELAVHITKNAKEEMLPFVPRFTFLMVQQSDVWRLNEIDVTVKVPLADPAFLKSIEDRQRSQSEQITIYAVQSIVGAEKQYSAAQGGYACTLSALADANKTPDHKIYLFDRQLMTGKKNGYIFAISGCDPSHYKVVAEPEAPNSGQRAFCSDESGAIRASADGKGTSCLSRGESIQGGNLRIVGGNVPAVSPLQNVDPEVGRSVKIVPMNPALPGALGQPVLPQRVRVSSGVMQGLSMSKVPPEYPEMARVARVQGSVVMAAIIGKDGTVQNLKVISSDSPLLNQAALDAVKQWKYRPYLLNGNPVEVDTQMTVNFTLAPQ